MKIEILCDEKWRKAWATSREALMERKIPYEQSLQYALNKLVDWMWHESVSGYVIGDGVTENSFTFREVRKNNGYEICGGIIFHGLPGEGYQENGSIQMTPTYGWQTHT